MTFGKCCSPVISLSVVFARNVYVMLQGEVAEPQSLVVHVLSSSTALSFSGRIQTYILVTH